MMSGYASTGDVVNNIFNAWNVSSQYSLQTYLIPFFKSWVIGFTIFKKFRMNLR
jgi:hypothetical protein